MRRNTKRTIKKNFPKSFLKNFLKNLPKNFPKNLPKNFPKRSHKRIGSRFRSSQNAGSQNGRFPWKRRCVPCRGNSIRTESRTPAGTDAPVAGEPTARTEILRSGVFRGNLRRRRCSRLRSAHMAVSRGDCVMRSRVRRRRCEESGRPSRSALAGRERSRSGEGKERSPRWRERARRRVP